MSTFIVPIREESNLYIKKIIAQSEKHAEEKLYQYLFNKYQDLEGDSLEEITDGLWDCDVEIGKIYDVEEFT